VFTGRFNQPPVEVLFDRIWCPSVSRRGCEVVLPGIVVEL
jgi:hypothetical protein